MFVDTPDTLLYVVGGAILLGWFVGKLGAYLGSRFGGRKRDPRDDRIRNLDAELRIAQADKEKSLAEITTLKASLREEQERVEQRDNLIADQQQDLAKARSDLKDSVLKTRELRTELSERATENVKSEVKLREVETELSVAQASTDLIATGVLDYNVAPDGEESDEFVDQITAAT